MRALLDTHAFWWAVTDDPQLSKRVRQVFGDGQNELWLSVASVWELVIKAQIGKLPVHDVTKSVQDQVGRNQIRILPIELAHIARLEALPLLHRDPFDRILVAQSIEESLPLITADEVLQRYPIKVIW